MLVGQHGPLRLGQLSRESLRGVGVDHAGSEVVMKSAPSLYVLVVCLVMPFLYSLPTALISAELATNYPETGGQCVYVTLACGSLIGAHNAW